MAVQNDLLRRMSALILAAAIGLWGAPWVAAEASIPAEDRMVDGEDITIARPEEDALEDLDADFAVDEPIAVEATETIDVQISWSAMSFTYEGGSWDTDTLKYTGGTGWKPTKEGSNKFIVRNYSNVGVNLSCEFQSDYSWAGASFADEFGTNAFIPNENFDAATGTTPTSKIYYMTLTGTPAAPFTGLVGTLTLTLESTEGTPAASSTPDADVVELPELEETETEIYE